MNFGEVKAIVFDVDGVFTNSQLLLTEEGELLRSMNTRDGYMVRHAVKRGLHLAILTGGLSKGVENRFQKLGVSDIIMGSHDKVADLYQFCSKYKYKLSDILFVGDDYPDYHAMKICGYTACPADAESEIMKLSSYISPFKGGEGVVRDVLTKVLLSKNLPLVENESGHVSPSN